MKKWLLEYGLVMYLGFAVVMVTGFHIGTWQWWAICGPVLMMEILRG